MFSDRGINEQLRWIIAKEDPSIEYVCAAALATSVLRSTEVRARSLRRLSSSDCYALYFVWREVRLDMRSYEGGPSSAGQWRYEN
jgi:hypothetical protein